MEEKESLLYGPQFEYSPGVEPRCHHVHGNEILIKLSPRQYIALALYFCLNATLLFWASYHSGFISYVFGPCLNHSMSKTPVPLEAHIMSKCPDSKACLRELVLPTMQRMSSKVDFTLSYIGHPTENDGVECLHGAPECMGNVIELCAARLYPDPKQYLGFTYCLTKDYEEIPDQSLVKDCALEHGLDFEKLNECSSDEELGVRMLRNSVRRSSEAGVSTSCTVRLNNEIYCIHDGGKWKDCKHGPGVNDLVIAIEKLYSSS